MDTKSDFWVMGFTEGRRQNGPGHYRQGQPTQDLIAFQSDEGFSQQTCAIWHAPTGYMAVQYNHFGVRSGNIGTYLSQFSSGAFSLLTLDPVLREGALEKLEASRIQTKLTVGFERAALRLGQDTIAQTPSLLRMSETQFETGADTIEFTISLRARRGSLEGTTVKDIVRSAIAARARKLEVRIKEDENTETEVLNLLQQLEVSEISDSSFHPTAGLRWTHSERSSVIERVFTAWLRQRQVR